jgi:hypothetical protein
LAAAKVSYESDILEGHSPPSDLINSSRATGRLYDAIDESSIYTEADITDQAKERNPVVSTGIGNIPILEDMAPHWKYLEYGTYDMGAGEWPGEPFRPGESPAADSTTSSVGQKPEGAKGIAPNRAWRLARHRLGEHIDAAMLEEGFRKKTRRKK